MCLCHALCIRRGVPHNDQHLLLRNLETAKPILGVNDGPHPGPMRGRDDFPKTTRRFAPLQRAQGRVNVFIPKEERERQRPFNETLQQTSSGTATTGDLTGRR